MSRHTPTLIYGYVSAQLMDSEIDEDVTLVQIDTDPEMENIRVKVVLNDGMLYEGDVNVDEPPIRAAVGLPQPALTVLEECIAEAWLNTESGDDEAHTDADVAADIVERLARIYGVRPHFNTNPTHGGS